ncbi:MAG: hypothetical protein J6S92_10865 [Oscillospiraceae bacterium]|nr:hypothetical protein [Oscillospiraceae bacterium]
MTYMLNDIDEAIDRKFLVTKKLNNQVEPGTIVHIMDAHSNKDGSINVYYRITYTKQEYTVKFDNVKQFCKWARPDNFIARHYENFNIKEIQRYVKVKDRTFTSFCLPIILGVWALIWAISRLLFGTGTVGIVIGVVLSVLSAVAITMVYRNNRQKSLIRFYRKVSANSNWGVNFK